MHGNQAGDAAFTMDQYMLSDGPQAAYGTPEFDKKIRAAEALTGQARQDAFAKLFAEEPQEIMQMAYIAHMKGILGKSPRVDYTPNSATGDEMRLAEMTFAAPTAPTSPDPPARAKRETHVPLRPAPDVYQRTAVDHRAARRVPPRPAHR